MTPAAAVLTVPWRLAQTDLMLEPHVSTVAVVAIDAVTSIELAPDLTPVAELAAHSALSMTPAALWDVSTMASADASWTITGGYTGLPVVSVLADAVTALTTTAAVEIQGIYGIAATWSLTPAATTVPVLHASADPAWSLEAQASLERYIPVPNVEIKSSIGNGIWAVPDGVSSVTVHCIGGGGGTASTEGGFNTVMSPGAAGGAYAQRTFAVTPGHSINFAVAHGGSGGVNAMGAPGAPSWFAADDANGCLALGGAAGTGNPGTGTAQGCVGEVIYPGGNGAAPSGGGGGGGGAAGTRGAGGHADGRTGGGGTSEYGGNGGTGTTGNGRTDGSAYGGGGSGSRAGLFTTTNGANGAPGVIVLDYEVMEPQPSTLIVDDFHRDSLGPSWRTYGGGNLYLANNQLHAAGLPSEPVSFAIHNAKLSGENQATAATVRWNGHYPTHSSISVAVRADPASGHAGVHFWCTANLMGICIYHWSGIGFTAATGTSNYVNTSQFPDGAEMEIRAQGTTYTAYLDGVQVLQGAFTAAQAPLTNRYAGIHGEDDSAVPGGGQPPGSFENWSARVLP